MADQQWGQEVHTFYNIQPYWEARENRFTEGRGTRESERFGRDFERRDRGFDNLTQHSAAYNRMCARAMKQHHFELTEAVEKSEGHTNGQAISARCQLVTGDQHSNRNMDFGSEDSEQQTRDYDVPEREMGDDVVIEVTVFLPGDSQNVRIVTVSPENGEVLRTRSATLTGSRTQRSDAGTQRDRYAGSGD
jgi:hypothetical protein